MLLMLALVSALNTAPAADSIPGTWEITGDVAGNPVNTTCVIKQAGTALSGNCSMAGANAAFPLTGEAKDGKIRFQYEIDYQGQPLTIVYSGALEAAQLKGTIEVKPMGATGTFTGKLAAKKP
jgi:hypothetical protein